MHTSLPPTKAANFTVGTLDWNQEYVFPTVSLNEFAHSNFQGTQRYADPAMDTKTYSAFRETYTDNELEKMSHILNQKQLGDAAERVKQSRFFYKKDGMGSYKQISYTKGLTTPDPFVNLTCTARMPFLEDEFPQQPDGKYPYTIEFSFTATQIEDVAVIGAMVKSKITSFLDAKSL